MPPVDREGVPVDRHVSLGTAGLRAAVGDHIAHFYRTPEERKDILVPFVQVGLESGERCVYVTADKMAREHLINGLAAAGIKVDEAIQSGQLVLAEGPATTPAEMREWGDALLAESEGSFPLIRWGGDMSWTLKKMPSTEALMEWETVCNTLDRAEVVFLCQYNLAIFPGSTIIDAMQTHPLCIIGRAVQRNPFYLHPEQFLAQLHRDHPHA